MEIKKITKVERKGTRLFVELGKKTKQGTEFLPALKKGDEVLILSKRKLTPKQMENLVGKYVTYLEFEEGFSMDYEGIVQKNDKKYWFDDDEPEERLKEGKYILIQTDVDSEDVREKVFEAFDDLNEVYDLQVYPHRAKEFAKIRCFKCKKNILIIDKYCKYCGKKNRDYSGSREIGDKK